MVTSYHFYKPVMKYAYNSAFSTEKYEFKEFSEDEMAMIVGGGGDAADMDFMTREAQQDEDASDC